MTYPLRSGRKASPWFALFPILALLVLPAAARAGVEATPWARGAKLCADGKLGDGWRALAQVEADAGKKPLPAGYWREVLSCALRAGMPAHALRAGKALEERKEATPMDKALIDQARAATRTPDPARFIEPGEAWVVRQRSGGKPEIVSTPCGFAFVPPGTPPQLPGAQQAGCSVRMVGPEVQGKAGPQTATIVVLAKAAGPKEKLEDWLARVVPTWKPAPVAGLRCPAARCLGFGNRIPGIYGKDGDGVGLAIAFERAEPEFPGLALEEPLPVVKAPGGGTPYGRYRGRMLFLVQLDSAASIAGPAKEEFQRFLAELKLE